ncbi:family 20 glycosylhydrolase [Lactiplantibacillus paraxiangfangensis]|uniref:family 20 glycosylhydrolase n=1 Tax=Lactiplantibacillus paraxiangfangensis TaxID=3076224 RepID=UPI0030C76C09
MHKWRWGLLTLTLILGISLMTQSAQATKKSKGLILDNARQYYSVKTIQGFIRRVHAGGGTFIQLHLTDDHRYGVESKTLNQTTKNARHKGSVYYNRKTKLAFLSKKQLRSLIVYGHKRHVEVIPEIDTPGHAKALVKLLKTSSATNKKLAKQVTTGNEMNLRSAKTAPFVKKLLGEYVGLLYRGQHMAIGGDEYSASTATHQPNTVKYTNTLNRYLNKKHLKTTMWNDGLMRADLKKIDHNILITYWSYDGENDDPKQVKLHRKIRPTLPQLNKAGFQTINANFWYLYVITKPATFKKANVSYWKNDLKKNWNVQVWDKTNPQDLAKSSKNIGSAISIWGDGKKTYSQAQVVSKTAPFLTAYFKQ